MKRTPFPFRIFIQFFFVQGFAALIIFGIFVLFQKFSVSYSALALIIMLILLLNSYLFTKPIRQIIRKALRISSKKWAMGDRLQDEDLLEEEPGEYSLLASILDRIDRKLQKKRTQLAAEKEQTRAFMSSVGEGIVRIDDADRILFFNSQFGAQFLDPEMFRRSEIHLTEVLRVPEVLDGYRKALISGRSTKVSLWMNTRIEQQQRFFSVSMSPLRKENSEQVFAVIGIFHDMTDLKMAEQIRVDFVANASHELRTPLTAIKGYLDSAVEELAEGNSSAAGQFLSTVVRNVDNMSELVADLLTLSKLEHQPELKLEKIHSLGVTDEIVNDLSGIAKQKNQKILMSGQSSYLIGDKTKIEIVLRNLISNAMRYTQEGSTIQIRWSESLRTVQLEVEDDGPGIPLEHQARLFERFYRVDRGRNRDAGGTGLGLAIVKHIMQVHGGSIELVSETGKGAKFICRFPGSGQGMK